jgi:RNA polymerase sigma factor (sigma-70 family)
VECDFPRCDCARLCHRGANGDQASVAKLIETMTPMVESIAQKVVGTRRHVDQRDVVQEVFTHMLTRLASVDGSGAFCGWLAKVALRKTVDISTTYVRRANLFTEFANSHTRGNHNRQRDVSPEEMACLKEAVDQLPPDLRRVFDHFEKGGSVQELAVAEKKSTKTIYNWIGKMLARISSSMNPE